MKIDDCIYYRVRDQVWERLSGRLQPMMETVMSNITEQVSDKIMGQLRNRWGYPLEVHVANVEAHVGNEVERQIRDGIRG